MLDDITETQFENDLKLDQQESALYPFPKNDGGTNVFNFAIARVRLHPASATANDVRVFFRIFTSQSTSLEYLDSTTQGGYMTATNASGPIAVPGRTSDGSEWLSFPFFGVKRDYDAAPEAQTDDTNTEDVSDDYTYFGALIDNNRNRVYLREFPSDPIGAGKLPVRDLLGDAHQCLVAQIEYDGTPIPNGSTPSNSDKLAQRNIAFSDVSNPGLRSSRVALHTFEIQASTNVVTPTIAPDELLLEWTRPAPENTRVKVFISTWDAQAVVELADQLYFNHQIEVVDEHTVSLPGNGVRYIPVPPSTAKQTGIIMAELPLGVTKGQRFDLSVRQDFEQGSHRESTPRAVRADRRKRSHQAVREYSG